MTKETKSLMNKMRNLKLSGFVFNDFRGKTNVKEFQFLLNVEEAYMHFEKSLNGFTSLFSNLIFQQIVAYISENEYRSKRGNQ